MNRSRLFWARLVALLAFLFAVAAQAQGSTYVCDARFYQIRQPTGSTGSNLYLLDRRNLAGGGVAQWPSVSNLPLNALAYNKADGYFYAVNVNPITTGGAPYRLYRLGTTGAVELVPLANIPSASTVAAGTVDADGKMYIKLLQADSTIYTVQLPTSAGGAVGGTGAITLTGASVPVALADMAFDPVTNQLYGVYTANTPGSDGASVAGVVYRIDPNTGAVTRNGTALTVSGTNAIGTAFFDISGTLYAYQNGGTFGTINLSTGAFTRITAASAATQSDGASCVFPDERISGSKVAGAVQAISPMVFDVPYTVTVTNTGAIPDRNVQITEDLTRTFSTGTPTLTITAAPAITSGTATANTGFNGTSDTRLLSGINTLAPGASVTVQFTVRVTYPNTGSVPGAGSPVNNTVYATSTSTGPNTGYTFPGGTPLPPVDLLATYTTPPAPATVRGEVDLNITKSGPNTAVAGTGISYVLTLTNTGPSAANGATFSDNVTSALTGVTAVCQNATGSASGCNATVGAGNVVTGSVAALPSGGTVEVEIRGTIPANATGSLNNQATITAPGGTTETNISNNTSNTVTTTLTRTADLAVDKSAPAAVGAGGALTYTVRVWNNGPSTASAVSVNDVLPAGFTVTGVSCTVTGTATCDTQSFTTSSATIATGTLSGDTLPTNAVPDGNFLTYLITGTAPNSSGILDNTASITVPSGVTDSVSSNNTSGQVQTRVVNAVNDPGVTLAVGAGGVVSVLTNDTNGAVAATTSNSLATVSNAGGLTGLSVNASGQLVVPTGTPAGTYTVTYQLCDTTITTACDSATVPVTVSATTPNLSLAITGPAFARPSTVASTNPPVAASDQFVTYTLTVTTATANATGTTTVTTTLPSGLSWGGAYTATPGNWTCSVSGQVITCTTPSTITVGTPQTLTLSNVKVAPGTAAAPSFTTSSTVSNANESPTDAATGNSTSVTTQLILSTLTKAVRNVTVDARDNNGVARFGTKSNGLPTEVLEYCLDMQNLGGANLPNYVLTDALDSLGVALTAVTTDAAYGGKAIKWTRITPSVATTAGNYTAVAGDDSGTLNTNLQVTFGTLLAGEMVRTCFQTQIR
ncbi:DUF11 domain-containing protein [Deinococcus sp. QL22]|uniref:beta strand repeat-containing protein n=1 Tax=Deinococcus sp. QL22 TaxID=2939437 RepID=UPI0020182AA8|nr:DUF11 domain-containing protein [Deinococcus sp. QL22]UQN10157.1 DUF11 domain-containing protein [Deinococcus sp. QL22]